MVDLATLFDDSAVEAFVPPPPSPSPPPPSPKSAASGGSECIVVDDDAPVAPAAAAVAAAPPARSGSGGTLDPRACDINLLVLDPASASTGLTHALAPGMRGGGWERMLKRGLHTLVKPEYQLVVIDATRPVVSPAEARRTMRDLDEVRRVSFVFPPSS